MARHRGEVSLYRKRRTCLRSTAVAHTRLLVAVQSVVAAGAVGGVLALSVLPHKIDVFLPAKRGGGVMTLDTAWALAVSALLSIVLLGLYVRLFLKLRRSSAVRIDQGSVILVRSSIVVGLPVGLGLPIIAFTGWLFGVLVLFVSASIMAVMLQSMSHQSERRWILTADLGEIKGSIAPSREAST